MDTQWVVVLEAKMQEQGAIDEDAMRRFLEAFAEGPPVALVSPERYAVQLEVEAPSPPQALFEAMTRWGRAAEKVGIPHAELIRAEVLTPEELQRELTYRNDRLADEDANSAVRAAAERLSDGLLWDAFHDPLTELPTRGLFMDHLQHALLPGNRNPTVIVLKLLGLSTVRELWGSTAADDVLVHTANRLRQALSAEVTVARLDDDEFALLQETGSEPDAADLATIALQALGQSIVIHDSEVPLSVAIGTAIATPSEEPDAIVAQARAALAQPSLSEQPNIYNPYANPDPHRPPGSYLMPVSPEVAPSRTGTIRRASVSGLSPHTPSIEEHYVAQPRDISSLVEHLSPAIDIPTPAELLQARRNAEARALALQEFGALTSSEVAELVGSEAKNRSSLAHRWRKEGRLLGVTYKGALLFPGFQFHNGDILPVVSEVLAHFARSGVADWEIALWFSTPNGLLDDRRPADVLLAEPARVVAAALHEIADFGG